MATGDSVRVRDARARAQERMTQKGSLLHQLGWVVIIVVVASSGYGDPTPGIHGRRLGITIALVVYVLLLIASLHLPERLNSHIPLQTALILLIGAAGVALVVLQPDSSTDLAPSVAVWIAAVRLSPISLTAVVGGAITVAMAVVSGLTEHPAGPSVVAAILLCVLLAMMGHFMRRSQEGEDRTEILLAQLEDARDAETAAVAVAERSRIAGELHDVLAHSLSGLAIQIEGARMLADREEISPRLKQTIGRSAELVKDGLREARQAVGALHGDQLPGVDQLPALVERFGQDADLETTFTVAGAVRPLSRDVDLALFRGAQEALTNIARYAPSSVAEISLRYSESAVALTIADRRTGSAPPARPVLAGVGGGNGLASMRERVERAGGTVHAGPTADGWRVELEVPA
ncbi:MAG TPA: histidine kinase [Mycobacteriales bacterium]|nr:histidine kinase [Mycobacteriales bacterium]